jgi:hypothetical protein
MTPTVSLDVTRLNEDLRAFVASTGRDLARAIRDQARLLTRDLIGGTPPFGKHAFRRSSNDLGAGESYNEQRKIGEAAVRRDVRRVFQPFAKYAAYVGKKFNNPKLEQYLLKLGRQSDTDQIQRIFKKWMWHPKIKTTATRPDHIARRDRRGRVKRATNTFILDERSRVNYEKKAITSVGKAKAGWLEAAKALGLGGIPNWISRHNSPGLFQDATAHFANPSVTIGNLVEYASEMPIFVFQAALENRIRSMRIEANKIMEANHRKQLRRR